DVNLVVLVGTFGQGVEVVAGPLASWRRQAGENAGSKRGDGCPGNDAIGIHLTGERIDDRLAQAPLTLFERRDRREGDLLLYLAESFVIGEEERPVQYDRPANYAAELVAPQRRLAGRWLEVALGIECRVAMKFPHRSSEAFAAAPERRIDTRSACAAVLGRKIVRLHPELLDGVW